MTGIRCEDVTVADNFNAFFGRATGHAPYDYQRALALSEAPPAVLEVPTGAGKTQAILAAWLFARRVRRIGPRRLVYALPMRTLVEQTLEVARGMRERLGLEDSELPIHVLMGGEPPASLAGWRERPATEQILIGTVDMLLSRALNRGYGESRFQWPVSFGLLNSDCRWVLDEVQLMGPARSTSAQLDGLRAKLGTAADCETVYVSATVDREALVTVDRPELGEVLELSAGDRTGPLARRLNAVKRLERCDLGDMAVARLPQAVAQAVLARHERGTRSIVVLNRVELAQQVFASLQRETRDAADPPQIVLVHSRFRPPDRAERMRAAFGSVGDAGLVIVATQVIEAGVDVSARLLATETAPFSSIVQRLGRCNRAGEVDHAAALWLDRGELDAKAASPYDVADLAAARSALLSLEGKSLSPARMANMSVAESRMQPVTLRRRDLVDLFDTGPDLSGLDVDVSRFIRDDDERTVYVFFRELEEGERSVALASEPRPARDELVGVPIGDLRGRDAWVFDYVDPRWRRAADGDRYPGATLLLDASGCGYDAQLGWTGNKAHRPMPVAAADRELPEAIGDDPASLGREWRTLTDHLQDAETAACQLLVALAPLKVSKEALESVTVAAALHDVGKAHPVFQETLLARLDGEERERRAGTLWGKSALRGGRHRRRYFRHELASALALRPLGPAGPHRDLTLYLIAAHHGRVRISIRPAPDEQPPPDRPGSTRFALGVTDGDELPAVSTPLGLLPATSLDLTCMELGGGERSWSAVACELRDEPGIGVFRLAYLEALVRIADWRAGG